MVKVGNYKVPKELYSQIEKKINLKFEHQQKIAKIKASFFFYLSFIFLVVIPFGFLNLFEGVALFLFSMWISHSIRQYYLIE